MRKVRVIAAFTPPFQPAGVLKKMHPPEMPTIAAVRVESLSQIPDARLKSEDGVDTNQRNFVAQLHIDFFVQDERRRCDNIT